MALSKKIIATGNAILKHHALAEKKRNFKEYAMPSPAAVVFGIARNGSMTLEFFGGDIPKGKPIAIKVDPLLAKNLAENLGSYCLCRGLDFPFIKMGYPRVK